MKLRNLLTYCSKTLEKTKDSYTVVRDCRCTKICRTSFQQLCQSQQFLQQGTLEIAVLTGCHATWTFQHGERFREFLILPLSGLSADQELNFALLEESGLAILVEKRKPSRTTTHATFVGCYERGALASVAPRSTAKFPTPENFFTAAEDLLHFCQQLVLETRPSPLRDPAHDGKRQRLEPQDAMGGVEPLRVHNAQGERSLSYLFDPEGCCHFTRTRSDIATREQDLAVSFRVLEVERWKGRWDRTLYFK